MSRYLVWRDDENRELAVAVHAFGFVDAAEKIAADHFWEEPFTSASYYVRDEAGVTRFVTVDVESEPTFDGRQCEPPQEQKP